MGTRRRGIRDWTSGINRADTMDVNCRWFQSSDGTYISVVTTSVVLAGTGVLLGLTGTGVDGATHLVQIVEVYVR